MSGEESKQHVFSDDCLLRPVGHVERATDFYVSEITEDIPLPGALL